MLGDRIKQARLSVGLSQEQLAGREVTRSYICRLEKGKVSPSLHTLTLLANRLEKPVEYFLGSLEQDQSLRTAAAALKEQIRRKVAASDLPGAISLARNLVRTCMQSAAPEFELQARLTLLRLYEQAGLTTEAMELGEQLAERGRLANDYDLLAEVYLKLGTLHYGRGNLTVAKLHYERSLRCTRGKKSRINQEAKAWVNLGSCFYRLGQYTDAAASYRRCLALAGYGIPPELVAQAKLGLGWVLHQQGDTTQGLVLTREAEEHLDSLVHPAAVYARHNRAIMEGALHGRAAAVDLMVLCLAEYERRGDTTKQAAVLEELARWELDQDALDQAMQYCRRAFGVLQDRPDVVLFGRLYRVAAEIEAKRGHRQRAADLALLSLELLRAIDAWAEVGVTRSALERLGGPDHLQFLP